MLAGRIAYLPPPLITFQGHCIERVTSYRLLGILIIIIIKVLITVTYDLSCEQHVNSICLDCLKANKRLHLRKVVKR
jgi:hypothetical protein